MTGLKNLYNMLMHRDVERLMMLRGDRYRETFLQQDYLWLYERIRPHTTLLDIGASIGDTALYFAMNPKVDRVLSFEADRNLYARLETEMWLTPLRYKISTSNKRITDFKQFETEKNIAIKCDIEGDEYELFTHSDLRRVYLIQIEYHYGLQNLPRELRSQGFKVKWKHNPRLSNELMDVGWIWAER